MAATWSDVKRLVAEDDIGKWDIKVQGRELDWTVDRGYLSLNLGMDDRYFLSEWAEAQLSQKIRISVLYFRGSSAKMQQKQIMRWMRESSLLDKDFLIRLQGIRIRAILSGYYDRFDNRNLLELWARVEPVSKFYYYATLTDTFFHVRALRKPYTDKVKKFRKPPQGVLLRNSEVGMLALSARPSTSRYSSRTSRLVFPEYRAMFHKRHMGIDRQTLDQQFRRGVALSLESSKDWEKSLTEIEAKVDLEGY